MTKKKRATVAAISTSSTSTSSSSAARVTTSGCGSHNSSETRGDGGGGGNNNNNSNNETTSSYTNDTKAAAAAVVATTTNATTNHDTIPIPMLLQEECNNKKERQLLKSDGHDQQQWKKRSCRIRHNNDNDDIDNGDGCFNDEHHDDGGDDGDTVGTAYIPNTTTTSTSGTSAAASTPSQPKVSLPLQLQHRLQSNQQLLHRPSSSSSSSSSTVAAAASSANTTTTTTTTTNRTIPNKLPATPASIKKRNQRIRSSSSGNGGTMDVVFPVPVLQHQLLPPNQLLVGTTTPVQQQSSSTLRSRLYDDTPSQELMKLPLAPRLPPLGDDDEDDDVTTTAETSNNNNKNHEEEETRTVVASLSRFSQPQLLVPALATTSSSVLQRRKSKRSFGTCTTAASSCCFNVDPPDVGHHLNGSSSCMDDDDDDISIGDGGGDHHSVDTHDTSMTATKNFRFTSFPASLPRINNKHGIAFPATTTTIKTKTTILPQTVRKHMTFTTTTSEQEHGTNRGGHNYNHRSSSSSNNNNNKSHQYNNNSNTMNDSHNTSLSSWNNNHEDQLDGLNSDIDDDDDDDDHTHCYEPNDTSIVHNHQPQSTVYPTPRMRLNFNTVVSDSVRPGTVELRDGEEEENEQDVMMMMDGILYSNNNNESNCCDAENTSNETSIIDRCRSRSSSNFRAQPPIKNVTTTTSPSPHLLSPIRMGTSATPTDCVVLFGSTNDNDRTTTSPQQLNNSNRDGECTNYRYSLSTNTTTAQKGSSIQQLQFQLDAAQCSPIPVPEEMVVSHRISTTTTNKNSRTPNDQRRRITNSGSTISLLRQTATNSSHESSTTTSTVMSQLSTRPMPDMQAFDDGGGATHHRHRHHYRHHNYDGFIHPMNPNDSSRFSSSSLSSSASPTTANAQQPVSSPTTNDHHYLSNAVAVIDNLPSLSPKLLCPPTPVRLHPMFRTTTTAMTTTTNTDNDDDLGLQPPPTVESLLFHPYPHQQKPQHRQKIERSNSLIVTKMIATCSPQLLLLNNNGSVSNNTDGCDGDHNDDVGETTRLPQPTSNIAKNRPVHDSHRYSNNMAATQSANEQHCGRQEQKSSLYTIPFPPSNTTSYTSAIVDVTTVIAEPTTTTATTIQPQQLPSQVESVSLANNFDVISTLGSGTFADVYKVISKTDHRAYAIKRNRRQFRSKRDREVLLSEVRCMQRLQSQMTAPVQQQIDDQNLQNTTTTDYSMYLLFFYQAWQEDGHIYCQTELCCRDTCRELIDTIQYWNPSISSIKFPTISMTPWMMHQQQSPPGVVSASTSSPKMKSTAASTTERNTGDSCGDGRVVPEHVIWKICHDVCCGLSYLHSCKVGLVHNDIKPSNILFAKHTTSRYGAVCKIGDFGIARNVGSSEDGQEGDQKYMALEMLEFGTSFPSADIFSLGLTLYEMASHVHVTIPPDGHRWHELRSGNMNYCIHDFPSDRSPELIHLIRTMMDPNPIHRPSANDILSMTSVHDAGNAPNKFLYDYIDDVERYEMQEEEWMMHGAHRKTTIGTNNENRDTNNTILQPLDEQTPRNSRPLFSPPPLHNNYAKLPALPFSSGFLP